MKKVPHNQRVTKGRFCVDMQVTLPDGTYIEFRSVKDAALPEGIVRNVAGAVAFLLNMSEAEAKAFVDKNVAAHLAALANASTTSPQKEA